MSHNQILFIGNSSSGKRSLIQQICNGSIDSRGVARLALDLGQLLHIKHQGQPYTFICSVCDVDQPSHHSLTHFKKSSAHLSLLICVNAEKNADEARNVIQRSLTYANDKNDGFKALLVLTKCDSKQRVLSAQQFQSLSKDFRLESLETDALRKNSQQDVFIQLFKASEIKAQCSSRDLFLNEHRRLCTQDRLGCLGWFRTTSINYQGSLEHFVLHAKSSNNRSRRAMMNLGWMDADGQLTSEAPTDVKEVDITEQTGLISFV